jgi:hypothetical protein
MVDEFSSACPSPSSAGNTPVKEKFVRESLDTLYSRVAGFSQTKHLGIIGRARLAKELQA